MKQVIVIFLVLLLGAQQTFAQDAIKLASFREKVLPQYITYFNQADLTEKGLLKLSAIDKYIALPADKKKSIIEEITTTWKEPLILVHYGSITEMWGWDNETGSAKLLDEWGLTQSPDANKPKTKLSAHPWFFYIGDQISGDGQGQSVNFTLNERIGCYLLANRWDIAATIGLTSDFDSSFGLSLGAMSRVHFPIKNSKITPNIGGQVAVSLSSVGLASTSTVNSSLVIGISWFIGIGNVDFDFSIGNVVSGMGGYTVAPGMIKR